MAKQQFGGRGGRPLWLVIVVAIIGWAWQKWNAPQPATRDTSRPSATRTPRSSTNRAPSNRPPTMSEDGAQLTSDVVIKVSDGDTVKLQKMGTVRLIGVDTPEKAQEGGPEAAAWAQKMLMGKTVGVELCAKQPTDRYGRSLGFIYLTDRSGNRVLFNRELVRNGYGRVYSLRPCTVDDASWSADYEDARQARRGLFATLGDVPDAAEWRRARRK